MEICSPCRKQFKTEEEYLDHVCSKTGHTPREPEHLGKQFKAISGAALARGEARKEKTKKVPIKAVPQKESQ